jgi:hypothetical protein
MQPSSRLISRNRHDAARLAHATQLYGKGLRRCPVSRGSYAYPIKLVPFFGEWGNEGSETLGTHVAHQSVCVFAASKGAELDRKGAACRGRYRR